MAYPLEGAGLSALAQSAGGGIGPTALLLLVAAPAIGSFIGVMVDRMERQEDILIARSRCDACGAALRAADLVPLLSFALLGARSRCCGAPIRPFLPLCEAAALGVALWAVLVLPGDVLLPSVLMGWTLLGLSLIDLRLRLLPDIGTLGLVIAGMAMAVAGQTGPPQAHALGALAGYLSLAAVAWAYAWLRGIEGLGLGDAKLFAGAGAWLGLGALPSVLLIGALAGLATAAIGALTGRALHVRTEVPFGPGLALGFWLTWLYGPLVLG